MIGSRAVVLLLYYCCTTAVLLLYYCCTTVVLLLYYCCTTAVLLLYYCCTTVVLLLYYCCTTVVLLLYYIYRVSVRSFRKCNFYENMKCINETILSRKVSKRVKVSIENLRHELLANI